MKFVLWHAVALKKIFIYLYIALSSCNDFIFIKFMMNFKIYF